MHRANIVDDMNAMKYFKRCLNANIVAAIGGKYFRSMQDLLSYAIREEKKVIKVQQGKITWCIDLCQDKCAKKQPNMSSVVGEKKQSSTPHKKRGHAIPKVYSIDSSTKRSEQQQFNSKKDSIVQQEDMFVQQVIREMMRCVTLLWIIVLHQLLRELLSQSVHYGLKLRRRMHLL